MPEKKTPAAIKFTTKLYAIGTQPIIRLPETPSKKLPSRGQVMVEGTINGIHFQTPLEPDGKWSHWFGPDATLLKAAHVKAGDTVNVSITPIKEWPEPNVPADWLKAINADKVARDLWPRITPMARWEWIRWARATNNTETRKRRIEVGIAKMNNGERRPCCWNRNMCTEPSVSKSGVLLDPTP